MLGVMKDYAWILIGCVAVIIAAWILGEIAASFDFGRIQR
jgi:uncharacterized membrane protein